MRVVRSFVACDYFFLIIYSSITLTRAETLLPTIVVLVAYVIIIFCYVLYIILYTILDLYVKSGALGVVFAQEPSIL